MVHDGTVRVVQDFQGLNTLPESENGELGDLMHIMDEMEGFTCFSSIDVATWFLQLEMYEEDGHLTAFRDIYGKL